MSREVLHTFIKLEDQSAVDRVQFYYLCSELGECMPSALTC